MSNQALTDEVKVNKKQKRPSYKKIAAKYATHLDVTQTMTQIITAEGKLETILAEALDHLIEALGYSAAQIYRLSPHGQDVWLYLEQGAGTRPVTSNRDIFTVDEQNIISDSARRGEPVYIADIQEGPYSFYPDEAEKNIRSEVAVPLRYGKADQDQNLLGILRVQSQKPDDFDEADVSLLSSLAHLFASTIKNKQTLQQLQNGLQEAKILYNLNKDIDLDNQRSEGTQRSRGYRYDGQQIATSDELHPAAKLILAKETDEATTVTDNQHRELVAPIKLYGETIGLLGVEDAPEGAEWTADDIRLLEEISSQVALAIENSRLLQQTQEQTKELSLLFDTSRRLSETIELHTIYDILASQIITYLQADLSRISLFDKSNNHINLIIEKKRDKGGRIIDTTQPTTEAVASFPLLQRLLDDPQVTTFHFEDPEARPALPYHIDKAMQTLSVIPLNFKGVLVGILEVGHLHEQRRYTDNEYQLTQAIISQIAVAIENAQQFQRTGEALAETRKLYQISRALVEAETLEKIYDVVIDNVKSFAIDRVSISLIDPNFSGHLKDVTAEGVTIVASWDRESQRILPVGTQISSAIFPLVEAFAQPPFDPLISENLSRADNQDRRMDEGFRLFMHEGLGAMTLFSTPMFLGAEYKGVLSISTRQAHTYTDQEIRVYQTLADQAIIAIENRRLFEAIRQERDQTSLLHDIDRALGQAITIDQVEEIILDFTEKIGAVHGEIYVSDGRGFLSMASTISDRQKLTISQARANVNSLLGYDLDDDTLATQLPVITTVTQIGPNELANALTSVGLGSLILTPIHSQRSTLRGLLLFLHPDEDHFTQNDVSLLTAIATQTLSTLENVWLLQQTTIALSEAEILYEATRDFNQARHPEELLDILAKSLVFTETGTEFDIDNMIIVTTSELAGAATPKKLSILARWYNQQRTDVVTHMVEETEMRTERYPFLSDLNAQESVVIYYQDVDEVSQQNIDKYFGQARSILAIPLTVGNNWLGILFLTSHIDNFTFTRDLTNRVTTLAGHTAVVIQNLQLIEETQQTLYNSEILSQLGQQLLEAESKADVYKLCLNAIAATEPGRGAAIFQYEVLENDIELELVDVWDSPSQNWSTFTPGTRFSAQALGLTNWMKRGKTIVIGDTATEERFSAEVLEVLHNLQLKSLVTVPILFNKEVQGFILISHHESSAFSNEIIRLYEDMARQVSGALENLRLLAEAQHRARLLQTATEVSQAATSYLDLNALLFESVDLIKERFEFYHVSIFLVDEYQKYAVVKASTGEVGKKMVAMPHKLEVGGRSIVGTATVTGKARIAGDVGTDSGHFNNPLLPDTRSEMALPLLARGEVIGALDVQSTKRNAFSEIDITILQSMANQLANAIEAAKSFQESQKSLEQVRQINEYHLRQQWGTFLRDQKLTKGYRLTDDGFTATEQNELATEIDQAMEAKQPLIIPKPSLSANGNEREKTNPQLPRKRSSSQLYVSMPETEEEREPATLVAPLSLQNEVIIGTLDLELPHQNSTWEEDNLEIIEAVTRQAAQAIEATRLFEQTQAAREEAEALYRVGRALVTAESEKSMFRTVLDEMLTILGLQQGGILLLFSDGDRTFGKMMALFREGQPEMTDEYIPIQGNPSYERLIATKKPLAIEDAINDPLLATVKQINISRNVASLLLVPIIINDEVIGAIGADSVGQKHKFTEWEINLASAMADQLAIMLQNRRLLQETRRQAIQLQTSADVGRVATAILDEDMMLERAVELIKDRFGFYHVQILLVDDEQKYVTLYKSTGQAGKQLLATNYRVAIGSQSIIGQATARRKSLVIREANPIDFEASQPQHLFLPQSQAELAIPLLVRNELIGVLDVHSSIPNDFTDEDITTLEILGAQLAIAIQNARTFREQQETAERLREMDKLKTQFLANMSHELRTPLNSIIGFSRVILKGIDGPLTELQKTDLTSIHHSGQHLLSLINNILDLSKIEAGKMELNFEEIEIEPIIKGVMSTALALVKDKPVELRQEVDDDLPVVWADPTRIRQIVLNLVSNACKFTDEGHVTLRATADPKYLTLSVSDTGVGIPKNQIDSIFEEFTQVDASTTRKVGGTGLGLPISRYFVEMHQGKIWVESAPGKGSTFHFTIPVKPPDQNEADLDDLAPVEDEDTPQQEQVIAAIDDDAGVLKLYERFLEPQGYQIIGISNGKKAVERVKEHMPAVVLLDVLMPDKDGWSILRELKKDPYTINIPVIICSIVSDRKRATSLGAVDYLTKPITGPELLKALKHIDQQAKEQTQVLVIDDQADDILLIRRILEAQSNYSILEAQSGQFGLELARNRQPDLIILDLNMPKVDGFEVVKALKEGAHTRNIPIIIVSAKDVTSEEEAFLTGQVEAILHKGLFTENQLLKDVQQALSHPHQNETTQI